MNLISAGLFKTVFKRLHITHCNKNKKQTQTNKQSKTNTQTKKKNKSNEMLKQTKKPPTNPKVNKKPISINAIRTIILPGALGSRA